MRHSHRRHRSLLTPIVSVAAALAICGSGASMAATSSHHRRHHHSKPKPHKVTSSVAGTWSGQYSGAFSGSFTLHWTQSGSSLNGSIVLSYPSGTYGINGSVHGNAITFGAVLWALQGPPPFGEL